MNREDVNYAIDMLRITEEDLRDEKTRLRRVNDRDRAMRVETWLRQIFAVRQLLETERKLIDHLRG